MRMVITMLIKELKEISKNYVYLIVMLLPLLLTFVMSQGTINYAPQPTSIPITTTTTKPVSTYTGIQLASASQFAVSELSFMLLMTSDLVALSMFRERKLHIWDRVNDKKAFISAKIIAHIIFAIAMIAFNIALYKILFNIAIPYSSTAALILLSLVATLFGICIGISSKTKSGLSGTVLMSVMTMGYFGGALSLTSVLANTKYMNQLMYISPLTHTNQIIYKSMLNIDTTYNLYTWIAIASLLIITMTFIVIRRIKNGTVL